MYSIIGVLIIQFQVLGWTDATGKIATKFLNYHNPEGKQLDGSCCDKYSWWGLGDCKTGDTCDPGFVICLGNITESSSIDQCQYGRKTTGQLSNNANNIKFEEKVGEINNPLVFEFEEWPGIVKLNILAIDADGTDKYDIVDTFGYQYNKFDLVRELDTDPKTLQLSGSRSSLNLELKVFCDTNYYGPNCKVYCVPRDDEEGHFMCDPLTGERNCMPGWSGVDCLTNKDDCTGHRCSHGATCKDEVNSYTCVCPVGRTGRLCEAEINECSSNPCKHGGKCKDALGFFYCECPVGTSGDYCEIDVIECVSDPCQNNATCVDEINAFQCVCQAGFTGGLCEEEIDECASGPCVQALECRDLVGDYQCVCSEGFTGKNCEINIDECESKPCQNNGHCFDAVNSYSCICRDGTSGKYCEINFDECESNPCQNGGSCDDQINSYTCQCPVSYTGKHCETKIQPCDSKPCENGATCVNKGDNFTCNCLPGFDGFTCEENVNECESDPCMNGGICLDMTGKFQCRCPPNTSGEMCEALLETTTIPTTEPTTIPTTEEVTTDEYTDEMSTVIPTDDVSTDEMLSQPPDEVSSPLPDEVSSPLQDEVSSPLPDEVSSPLPDEVSSPIQDEATTMSNEVMNNVTEASDEEELSSSSTADNTSTTLRVDLEATASVLPASDDGDNETMLTTTPYQAIPDVPVEELRTRDFRTTDNSSITEDVTESDADNVTASILEADSVTPPGVNDTTLDVTDLDSADNVTTQTSSPGTLETVSPEMSSEEIGVATEEGSGDIAVTPVIAVQDTDADEGSGAVIATEPLTMLPDATQPLTKVAERVSTATTTATASLPGTASTSTLADASESSIDVEFDSTASGDLDEALTSLSPRETMGIDVSESIAGVASGDTTEYMTSTQDTRLTSSKVIDDEDVGSGATVETLLPKESTLDELEYSVVTSDAPLTTPIAEVDSSVDSSGDVEVDTTDGEVYATDGGVDTTDGEASSGEIVTSAPLTSTAEDVNATSPLTTSQAVTIPVTLSTSSPEKENLSSTTEDRQYERATDLYHGSIEENIFAPEFIGTTPPLLIFPNRPRSTTVKYIPKRTPKPYIPKTTRVPTEKPSSLQTTTLEMESESVTTWIYDTMSTLSRLFTTTTTTTTTTTSPPRTTTTGEAEPPPPIILPTKEPQDQRTNRGDIPPEEDDTTTPRKPTKTTPTPVPTTSTPVPTTPVPTTPVPTKNIPYPSKSVTWPKPVIVKTTPKTTVIPSLGFPSIRTTVYHTVKNAYNVGKKIADTAYKKSKALLHRTIRRMTDLWKLCVRNAMKAVYTPYNYIRNLYNTSVNKGNRLLSNAYKYTYSGLRKVYGYARRTMSNYYNYLRAQYKRRYNYYYTQYYNYYRNLKNKWWNYFG